MHERLKYLIKHNSVVQFFYRHIMSFVFRFIGLFVRMDDKLILFNSYGGERYDDSSKVLYEAIIKDNRFADYHFVWAFDRLSNFTRDLCPEVWNERTKLVTIDTLSYFVAALKAKVWITNVNIERGLHFKKKKTIYLNTWHGTGPKKSGNAIKGRNDYDFSYVDILCVDGKHSRNSMVKWFNARDEHLLYSGRPREDELFTFDEETKKNTRADLGIPPNKKIILYMPTWREDGDRELSLPLWEKRLSKDYVLLIRKHHFSKANSEIQKDDFVFDVSKYHNVNELYWISDILISDYSSAFFDYGLLGKPMICFAYDYDQYEKETGFIMDLKNEFPNGIKKEEEQVIDFIQTMNYESESKKTKAYVDGYVTRPLCATKICLDRLYELATNNRK